MSPKRLFISYAHVDKTIVKEWVVKILRDDGGQEVWFDEGLVVGADWKEQLLARIKACDALVFCMTPESVTSEWCLWELEQAVKYGKDIIPVLLQANTKIPASLSHLQYADFTDGATGKSVAKLMRALQTLTTAQVPSVPEPSSPQPTPEPTPEPEPLTVVDDAPEPVVSDEPELIQVMPDMPSDDIDGVGEPVTRHPLISLLFKILGHSSFQGGVALIGLIVAIIVALPQINRLLTPELTPTPPSNSITAAFTPQATPLFAVEATPTATLSTSPSSTSTISYQITPTCGGIPADMVCVDDDELPSFAMDAYEVKRADFCEFARDPQFIRDSAARSRLITMCASDAQKPVVSVTWDEARQYCQLRGNGYDLPTEAQWLAALGWTSDSEVLGNFAGQLLDVGQYANPLGIYDLAGNAAEWVRADDGRQTDYRAFGGDYRARRNEAFTGRTYTNAMPIEDLERIGFRCIKSTF